VVQRQLRHVRALFRRPAPPLHWKSRKRSEISTFPPRRRRRLLLSKQKPNPRPLTRPKTNNRTTVVLIKPDNLKS
jgi:hypothetical protein